MCVCVCAWGWLKFCNLATTKKVASVPLKSLVKINKIVYIKIVFLVLVSFGMYCYFHVFLKYLQLRPHLAGLALNK